VAGPAQQLPCDVFQVHGGCTWRPNDGRESASIDAFLEGCKAFPQTNTREGTKS
jgi:hypothetical protein